jgi:F420-dependent oxidoreductase-like protein
MRVGMPLKYAGGFLEGVDELVAYERAGLQIVFVPEAYSFDSVSQLGYIAARTETLEIASGILQIYSRTPALIAMTAAGLDYVSGGRFTLGIGASGPQVVEGFHGMPYKQPLGRIREVIEICRSVCRLEKLEHDGKVFSVPLTAEQGGTGLGKPLRLINHPVRERIPIMVAALGDKSVAQAARIAEAWEPIFYFPERARQVWGESLDRGLAARDPELGPLDIVAGANLAIGDDVDELTHLGREQLALYVGGMGARGKNFYNDLAVSYGYEEAAKRVQNLYLDGKKAEAAAAIPDELVRSTNLIGPLGYVKERLAALAESGVTTVTVTPVAPDRARRISDMETVRTLLS